MYVEGQLTEAQADSKVTTIDEAYYSIGKLGKYQLIVYVSSFVTMITCMMYVFSLPLFLIFPKVTGCISPETNSTVLCADPQEACTVPMRVYENNRFNFITEFDLACNYAAGTLIPLSFIIGNLIGSLIFSAISDNFGRLKVICIGQLGNIACIGVIMIAGNYLTTMVMSGLCGFVTAASGTPTYAFAYDSIHPDRIKFSGTLINIAFAVGEIIIALLMWTGISWRFMCLLICLWSSLFFVILTQLVEAPKFLLSKGKPESALASLRHIAEMNGKPLPPTFVLRQPGIEAGAETETEAELKSDIQKNMIKMLFEKEVMLPLLMTMMLYFSCGYIYYGISMNIQSYGGNIYKNACINGIVEVVAVVLSGIAMSRWGIKLPFAISFGFSGIFMLLIPFVTRSEEVISMFIAFGKFGISACFNFVYVIVGELFPTRIKNTVLGPVSYTHLTLPTICSV
eukprot:TRINITY_DN3775_c0_g1_i10.p1 TRINITY_DN3775_c0_g1~~TRINITY_DN3775_c0_g1_i10.p1  ORF type:complete len:455 (-),score=92.09 TRINITY_DN3775_c0_g1_i10:41-1405(-)